MHLNTVYSADGHLLDDPSEAGKALRRHWAPVFGARVAEGAEQHMEQFETIIVKDAEFGPSAWPRGELAAAAAKLSKSAPGPDRVPYQVWELDDPELDRVLDQIADDVVAGRPPPPGLNESYTVFIPKGGTTTKTPARQGRRHSVGQSR